MQIFVNFRIKRKHTPLNIECAGSIFINNDEISDVIHYSQYKKLCYFTGVLEQTFSEGLLFVRHYSKCRGQSSKHSQQIPSLM